MKNAVGVCLILTMAPCFAKIEVELGLKTTRFFIEDSYGYVRVDSVPIAFDVDFAYERYVGVSSELLVSFIKNLYLRMELIEYRLYDRGPIRWGYGGSGLNIISNLDVDVIYILPSWHRVSPLVYGGIGLEDFYGKPLNDMRAWGPAYEYRIGLGVNYRLTPRVKMFVEVQSWTCFQYTKRLPLLDELYSVYYDLLGLGRVNLGCRIRL